MKVDFYSTESGYGFLSEGQTRLYFRGEDFLRVETWEPMPITGEEVIIERVEPREKGSDVARGVRRISTPIQRVGIVESFDNTKGWGFLKSGLDGSKVFLHRSEMEGDWVPIKGSAVKFYEGFKGSRPRACYVSKMEGSGN